MTDRHVRRSGDDYAAAFASLLPTGSAWPRDPQSVLMLTVSGLAQIWGDADGRAADLLEREADPRVTIELLPDWERAFGLPDPCVDEPLTVADRQRALVVKMTTEGGQSRDYFIAVAAALGYEINIREYAPFMVGVSQVGDTRPTGAATEDFRWQIGPTEMRFYWTVQVGAVRLSWFRASSGQAGVDPHLRISLATDLECVLRRWKPGHTDIIFDYSGLSTPNPMAGTP
ncbi:MAG TPA: putative phage tail protein [Bradyrhizobium sp.]|jgi:uncharacterized protein YmfQ (DUF2313 family)